MAPPYSKYLTPLSLFTQLIDQCGLDKSSRQQDSTDQQEITLQGIFDYEVLNGNLQKLKQQYARIIEGTQQFDEMYFVTQNEKIKTPLKML